MKKIMISALVCIIVTFAHAKRFDFIDANIDDFTNRFLSQDEEKNEFKAYYNALSKKIQEADETKRHATFRYLNDLALNHLKEKHTDWYEEILPIVSDPRFVLDEQLDEMRKILRFFLTRYGAFEEYLNLKKSIALKEGNKSDIQAHVATDVGLWETIKSYVSSARNSIVSWFGFGDSKTTVA